MELPSPGKTLRARSTQHKKKRLLSSLEGKDVTGKEALQLFRSELQMYGNPPWPEHVDVQCAGAALEAAGEYWASKVFTLMSDELKANSVCVVAALQAAGGAKVRSVFRQLAPELRNNTVLVQEYLNFDNTDRSVVLQQVARDGEYLENVSAKLKGDPTITCLAKLNDDNRALPHALLRQGLYAQLECVPLMLEQGIKERFLVDKLAWEEQALRFASEELQAEYKRDVQEHLNVAPLARALFRLDLTKHLPAMIDGNDGDITGAELLALTEADLIDLSKTRTKLGIRKYPSWKPQEIQKFLQEIKILQQPLPEAVPPEPQPEPQPEPEPEPELQVVPTAQAKFAAFFSRMGLALSIQGLDATPLSSLLEAVKYIAGDGAPSQAQLSVGCDAALQKADALLAAGPDEHGLTRDEIAAIHLYTQELMSMYRALNKALWSQKRGAVKPYWGFIRLLQHALFKVPKCEDGAIYRGIKNPYEPITEIGMLAKATQGGGSGEPEIWWGFSSCSTDLQATKAFLGQSGTRVLYTIEGGSSARDVRKYSEFPKEAEVLMPFGSAFTVVTAMQTQALLLVTLRQTHEFVYGGAGDGAVL
jgi:hypothetical protein